ncbi:hypothetical protein HELRODRAFT_173210 [Helobdella robusta]|uniref:Endonuclease/exonuclease/phosphatase domain-containing protein n=1 Tax=Helobdella robusta TaxID=6412 RepID=T1F6K7_HELRO|nr:hypothetical protein HELRODRAFT_173210 [Helobdella robusta]ESO04122.1 hypothetical protein HELRODRAFT_173210 [Helobdella robusta]
MSTFISNELIFEICKTIVYGLQRPVTTQKTIQNFFQNIQLANKRSPIPWKTLNGQRTAQIKYFKFWIAYWTLQRNVDMLESKELTSVFCRKQDGNQMVSLIGSYKLFWNGQKTAQNGVGIFILESLAQNETDESEDTKSDFWNTLSDAVRKTPSSEIPLICGDLNGHKKENSDFKLPLPCGIPVHGKGFGSKSRQKTTLHHLSCGPVISGAGPNPKKYAHTGSDVARVNKVRAVALGTRSCSVKYATESQKDRLKMGLIVGVWNVRSLWQTGAYALMKKELERFRYDVVGLCEVRWTGGGEMEEGKILWSGTEREHVYGVGMVIGEKARKALLEYNPVNERMAFYDQLEQTLNVLPKKDVKIITGDWNAKIGRDNIGFEEVMGKYGIGNRNNRGERLLEFAKDQKMYITNTKTQNRKKWTLESPDGKTTNMIDLILIEQKWMKFVTQCRAFPTLSFVLLLHQVFLAFEELSEEPLHPIIPGNNRNKSNNAKSNTERNPNNNNNNNTKTVQHRIDNNKFQQIKVTAKLIYKKTQLTHHINNWKEDRAKILKTTINNLKDNINPPNKKDTFNQTISNILDNTYETIKNSIINHLNNELSNYNTIHYKNIDLIDDTKPIEDHIRLCNVKTLSKIVSDNNDEINLKVEKINEMNGLLKNELKLIKEMLNSNSAKLDSLDRPDSKLSATSNLC